MRLVVSLLALLVLSIAPARAAETRSAPEGHVPPQANVEQLAWLTGIWEGEGIGGAPATEAYSRPGGGSLAGHFVQQDGEGGVQFFEILQIAEVEGSLVYRLKHFDDRLGGWEEKDAFVSFPLVAIGDQTVWFDGLTLRREGNTLISAVLVRQADGSTQELVFRYRRVG